MTDTNISLQESLAGKIVVSTPKQAESKYEGCVVLIYENGPLIGTQGVVVNRRSSLTVRELLERMDYLSYNNTLNSPLYHGGYSDDSGILMVHSGEWYSSNTRPVTEEFSVSSDTFMIEKLAVCDEPYNWMMCAGKCAWEPGELEEEIGKKYWVSAPATPEIVFSSTSDEKQWRNALEHCTKFTVDSWF
jgi:putative transcriptional regulator